MKIAICYPPIDIEKRIPQISQNRQFQWTMSGPIAYFIYPVVPAYAASLLKSKGFDVYWLDGLAEKFSYSEWLIKLEEISPDLIAIETKTPVIKYHWEIIDDLKRKLPNLKIVLMGDHVTAFPKESMENSKVDFVLTGGDYDFSLLNLVNHLLKKEKLEPGIWYRKSGKIINSGPFMLSHNLDELPLIDRDLTKWNLYAYKNSNFFRAPGAYTMFGRDCWWGKCTFCSWTTLFPGAKFRSMSVSKAISEIENLVENYQVKEIMDDSGSFPIGEWLREFCREIIRRNYQKKVKINCNMRFNSGLQKQDYELMFKAGFRFILFGLESANQKTLDRVKKNLKFEDIEKTLKMVKSAGLWPHITVMVGYPWERKEEIDKTIFFVKSLFEKGLVNTMQATIVIPYPGTPLFEECKNNNLLKTLDWNEYDMRSPVMKTSTEEQSLLSAVRSLYSYSIWNKSFILNTVSQLKSWDGIKYVSFQGFKYLGKLLEFKK